MFSFSKKDRKFVTSTSSSQEERLRVGTCLKTGDLDRFLGQEQGEEARGEK